MNAATDRQLRFAETDVAAQQPVHRPGRVHVALDVVDRRELVGRFLVRERGVEFALPFGIRRECDSRPGIAGRLQLDHLGGQVGHRPLGRFLLPHPRLAADVRK